MPEEPDAFGRPRDGDDTDAFGRPVVRDRRPQAPPGWEPPVATRAEPAGEWRPPVSPTPGPAGDPAGWWRRVGATLIDGLVVGSVAIVIGVAVSAATGAGEDATTIIGALVGLMLGAAYYGHLMSRAGERNGQTWGKQATSVRVVRTDGAAITFGFALFRELLVKTILFGYLAAFTLYIATAANYLWPLGDGRNRALHDHVAKTLVRTAP